ncbi:hypothetical protein AB0H73_10060 [Streptomyces olivoreticuli]
MGAGYAGDVDEAVENYGRFLEGQADALERIAVAVARGTYGAAAGLGDEDRAELVRALCENVGRNRAAAIVNRSPEGGERLRTTGLWLAG